MSAICCSYKTVPHFVHADKPFDYYMSHLLIVKFPVLIIIIRNPECLCASKAIEDVYTICCFKHNQ